MTASAAGVLAIYNVQLCLWVEDIETKAYLDVLWGDGRIRTLVGGGGDTISGLAHAAWADNLRHVFALRDRDFDTARMPPIASGPVFVSVRHEVENYLLDEHAIAACEYNTRGATAGDIDAKALQIATDLVPWMASRRVLRDMWSGMVGGFPPDPKPGEVASQADAAAWLTQKAAGLGFTGAQVQALTRALPHHCAHYSAQVASGHWRAEFSGKEILEPLIRWVWNQTHKNPGGGRARTMVAAAIADRQRAHATVPGDLAGLRDWLLDYAGLQP
jgi:hypothetical protein